IRIRGYGGSRLPLLYCMRCALAWEPFAYRLVDDDTIDILEARRGERCWEDWDCEVGYVSLPERQFDLLHVPEPVQELYDVLNGGGEITAQDEAVICTFTGHYADPEVGSYPIIDAINRVGGR